MSRLVSTVLHFSLLFNGKKPGIQRIRDKIVINEIKTANIYEKDCRKRTGTVSNFRNKKKLQKSIEKNIFLFLKLLTVPVLHLKYKIGHFLKAAEITKHNRPL